MANDYNFVETDSAKLYTAIVGIVIYRLIKVLEQFINKPHIRKED